MAQYFGEREEQAVLDYIAEEDVEKREKIFREKLYAPIAKISECVFRRHTFAYSKAMFGEDKCIEMVLTHLVSILPKYVKGRGKAFSYLTFCARNYLIQQNDEAYAETLRLVPIAEEHEDDPEMDHKHTPKQLQVADEVHRFDWEEFMGLCVVYWQKNKRTHCTKQVHYQILDAMLKLMKDPSDIPYTSTTPGVIGKKDILRMIRDETGIKSQRLKPFLDKMRCVQSKLLREYQTHGTVGNILNSD